LGGEYIGRAYDPSEIAGDDAIGGKLELQWTSPMGQDFLNQHQFFAYYDYGHTWLRASTDDFELASVGVGARMLIKGGYFASLELAAPLTRSVDTLGDKGKEPRLFFVLSSNF
jgi:hemolysin activation/secretion protein